MFEWLFTISLLVLGLAFVYYTFLFEFMKKDAFPQFMLLVTYKILEALYCNKFKGGNLKVCHCDVKEFCASTSNCIVSRKYHH